jgi:hypothetical protein
MNRPSFSYDTPDTPDDPERAARAYTPAPGLTHREIVTPPSATELAAMRARGVAESVIEDIIARAKASPKMRKTPAKGFAK